MTFCNRYYLAFFCVCSDSVPRKLSLLHLHADWLGSSCHHDYSLGCHHRDEIQRFEVRIGGRVGDDPGGGAGVPGAVRSVVAIESARGLILVGGAGKATATHRLKI